MKKEINNHIENVESIKINNTDELEKFRLKYISKKGIIPHLFSQLKNISNS